MSQSSDYIELIMDLVRQDIQSQLKKIRASRAYDGTLKPVNGGGFTSISQKQATGRLYESLQVEEETLPNGDITIKVTMAPYWKYVNYGRRGRDTSIRGNSPTVKYPPLSAISNWIANKGLPQFRDKRGRFISNRDRLFLVQRSIGEYGIFPTLFIEQAVEDTQERVVYYLGEYGKALLTELLQNGNLFNQN